MPENEIQNEVTTVGSWKVGSIQELPSGNFARLQKRQLMFFVKTGKIPNSLSAIVQDMITPGKEVDYSNEGVLETVDLVVSHTFVEPKVILDGATDTDNNIISIHDLEINDKMYVWGWSQGGVKDLESFRLL